MAEIPSPKSGGSSKVSIAGKKFPKTYVYVGAAAVVGIVGYAYITNNGELGEEEDEPIFDEFGNPIAGPTPGLSSPQVLDSNLTVNPDDGRPINNYQWGEKATDYLQRLQYAEAAIGDALGAFIAKRPLTPAQATIVRAAIAGVGYPPHDGPWNVIEQSTPIAIGLIAPKNLRVTGTSDTSITFAWDAVPGATAYEIEEVQGVNSVRKRATISGITYVAAGLRSSSSYRLNVRAKNASSVGDKSTVVGKTTGPARVTVAPTVKVASSTRTSITFTWNAIPGVPPGGYLIEGIEGLNTVKLRVGPTQARSYTWTGRRPNTSYRLRVRGARSKDNIGPSGTATGKTKK